MKEVRFGIIGTGAIANLHMSAIDSVDGASIVAVADVVEDKAGKIGRDRGIDWYTDYRDLLGSTSIDVVCICTPSGLRGEIAIDAARAGKHIVAEKPLEITLEKVDAVISECDRANVKLAVIFQNRFMEGIRKLKTAVDQGRLGRIVMGDAYVKWYRSQEYYDSAGWRGTWALDGGGALMNQAIHHVDLLQWIMGSVETVFAHTDTLVRERIEVEDTAVACLRFEGGAMGVIEACTSSYPGMPAKLEIHGDKGTIITEDGKIKLWRVEGEPEYVPDSIDVGSGASDPSAIGSLGHERQLRDMVEAVRDNRPPIVEGREGRKSVEIITAIYRSAKTGAPVKLPL